MLIANEPVKLFCAPSLKTAGTPGLRSLGPSPSPTPSYAQSTAALLLGLLPERMGFQLMLRRPHIEDLLMSCMLVLVCARSMCFSTSELPFGSAVSCMLSCSLKNVSGHIFLPSCAWHPQSHKNFWKARQKDTQTHKATKYIHIIPTATAP